MFLIFATVGLVLLVSKFLGEKLCSVRNLYYCIVNNICLRENDRSVNGDIDDGENLIAFDKLILADTPKLCNEAVGLLKRNLFDGVLGFDCEWVNEGPVSLLQLATSNGFCALFRIGKIGFVPSKLKELLSNDCILKVGVAPFEDGKKLTNDYGCRVFGTVDLRMFAESLGIPCEKKSLAALCSQYLGVQLKKTFKVRCGDWNADVLTEEQIEYAAHDALASVLVYGQIHHKAKQRKSIWESFLLFTRRTFWKKQLYDHVHNIPKGIVDVRYRESFFKNRKNDGTSLVHENGKIKNGEFRKVLENHRISSIPTRREPLYHNCYLETPDGEILCTCDRKKAEWYISKGRGRVVKEMPFTVRLNFEPSGRAVGEVGQYYTQVKLNHCVVCGSRDKFMKKNVVPKEYRSYFPVVMKAHQSHDIVLLCPPCHEISSRSDLDLRNKLASMCDAPLARSSPHTKNEEYQQRRKFLSAIKALKESPALPMQRRNTLEALVRDYAEKHDVKLQELLDGEIISKKSATKSSNSIQKKCPPHGHQVVEFFTNCEGGLVVLERIWREHFLTTMQPKYLPRLWSVSHNQERLEMRKIQNRINLEDAKVAGITK